MKKYILIPAILYLVLAPPALHAQRTDTTRLPKDMGIDTMRDIRNMDDKDPSLRERKGMGTDSGSVGASNGGTNKQQDPTQGTRNTNNPNQMQGGTNQGGTYNSGNQNSGTGNSGVEQGNTGNINTGNQNPGGSMKDNNLKNQGGSMDNQGGVHDTSGGNKQYGTQDQRGGTRDKNLNKGSQNDTTRRDQKNKSMGTGKSPGSTSGDTKKKKGSDEDPAYPK